LLLAVVLYLGLGGVFLIRNLLVLFVVGSFCSCGWDFSFLAFFPEPEPDLDFGSSISSRDAINEVFDGFSYIFSTLSYFCYNFPNAPTYFTSTD